jgi:hypothetical protein
MKRGTGCDACNTFFKNKKIGCYFAREKKLRARKREYIDTKKNPK